MIALTEPKLFQYLLYRGIIPKDSVSDYSISKVEQTSTRNNVFVVSSSNCQILVKQPKLFDEKNLLTFTQERTATKFMNKKEASKTAQLNDNNTDHYNKILFFDYQKDCDNLRKYILFEKDGRLIVKTLTQIFKYLFTKKHQLSQLTPLKKLDLPEFKPFFLSYEINKLFKVLFKVEHRDLARFCDEFEDELSAISIIWDNRNKDENFILHGDTKLDNILTNGKKFIIIDWELACYGDQLWDAVYFTGYLIYDWLLLKRDSYILSDETLIPFIKRIDRKIKETEVFNNYLAIVLLLFIYQNPSLDQLQNKVYELCGKLLTEPSKKLSNHIKIFSYGY